MTVLAMQCNENDDETDQNQWLVELTFLAMQVAAFCTSRETPSKPQNLQNVLKINENFDEPLEESLAENFGWKFWWFFCDYIDVHSHTYQSTKPLENRPLSMPLGNLTWNQDIGKRKC